MCPMGCNEPDTPEHCIVCNKLDEEETNPRHIKYDDIFSENVYKQAAVVQLIASGEDGGCQFLQYWSQSQPCTGQ